MPGLQSHSYVDHIGLVASGSSGGVGASYDVDAIHAIHARWNRISQWWPDLSQSGYPAALFRFSMAETLVQPDGNGFSLRHLSMTNDGSVATSACVVREADGSGNDGNQSATADAEFEALFVVRLPLAPVANQWGLFGVAASAGGFPFPDIFSLTNVCGVGYTTVDTDTPAADFEAITTSGTTAPARTRALMPGARDINQWLMISVSVVEVDGVQTARFRVLNMETGVEYPEITATTNLPVGARLHVFAMANSGSPASPTALDVAYIAVGTNA